MQRSALATQCSGFGTSIPPEKPRSLPAYLCSLVRNISLNRYDYNHAAKRNSELDLVFEELDGVISSDELQNEPREGEIIEAINSFLEGVKEKDRVIFVRRYYFSDSVHDIAEELGESEGAVAMRLSRLRAKLRKKMTKEGIYV